MLEIFSRSGSIFGKRKATLMLPSMISHQTWKTEKTNIGGYLCYCGEQECRQHKCSWCCQRVTAVVTICLLNIADPYGGR